MYIFSAAEQSASNKGEIILAVLAMGVLLVLILREGFRSTSLYMRLLSSIAVATILIVVILALLSV